MAKKTKEEVKATVENAVETTKEAVKNTTEAAKEVVSTVKEVATDVREVVTSKKSTWWNRIWSAIVGALIAVGSMFGITSEQVAEQKAKTEEVKNLAGEALEAIKKGDVVTAKAALELAAETGKQVIDESKKVIDNVKNADKEEVKETVKDSLIKTAKDAVNMNALKEAEKGAAIYTNEIKK